jgi:hypothetical protein
MFKSLVVKLKKMFKKKAAEANVVSVVAEKVVEGHLDTMEKIAEAVDSSVKNVEKTLKEEVKKVEKEVKKATTKKAPAGDKPAPKPKGRPKKTQ